MGKLLFNRSFNGIAVAIALISSSIVSQPPAFAADYNFSCTPDPTPGVDDRASETIAVSGVITISVTNCNFAYVWSGTGITPAASGLYIASGQIFTITAANMGAGGASLGVYVAGSYGKDWTFTKAALTPSITTSPAITGTTAYGQTLTVGNGVWSGSPTGYTYKWLRSTTSGGTYSDIVGAASSTYTLASTDVGQYVKAQVTATNSYGSVAALTIATSQVAKASQSLSFASTNIPLLYSDTLTVRADGLGTGAITYSAGSSTACTVNGSTGVVTATFGSGTCQITASIATDTNYLSGSSSNSVTISVSRKAITPSIALVDTILTYRVSSPITISTTAAGKATFLVSGKRIPGCISRALNGANSFTVTCSYKPATRGSVEVSVKFEPADSGMLGTLTKSKSFKVEPRGSRR